MTAALLIPVEGDVRRVDTTDDDIARIISAEWFELLVHPGGGFMVAVDEEGLLNGRQVNLRATALVRLFRRPYEVTLVGDALILGVNSAGDTVDVPLAGVAMLLNGGVVMQSLATDSGPVIRVGLVPIDKIRFHPHNVRTDLGDLRALSLSIAKYGLLQPVVLEKYGDVFQLRAGHRRVAAAKIANLYRVPAVIHPVALPEQEWLEHSIQENAQRRELDAGDRVRAVRALQKLGCTMAGIADTFGVTPSTVRSWMATPKPPATANVVVLPTPKFVAAGPPRLAVQREPSVVSKRALRGFLEECSNQGYNTDVQVMLQALVDGRPWRTIDEATEVADV